MNKKSNEHEELFAYIPHFDSINDLENLMNEILHVLAVHDKSIKSIDLYAIIFLGKENINPPKSSDWTVILWLLFKMDLIDIYFEGEKLFITSN